MSDEQTTTTAREVPPLPKHAWIMRAPVISTAHIKKESFDSLSSNPLGFDQESGLFVLPAPDGLMVYASDIEEINDLPDELQACLTWSITHGFEWLRFDRDGDRIDGLPVFDW